MFAYWASSDVTNFPRYEVVESTYDDSEVSALLLSVFHAKVPTVNAAVRIADLLSQLTMMLGQTLT